jgi:alpha-beta hydrolase superfamily lysophospholipase
MNKQFSIKSKDGTKLFGQAWLPETKTLAVINLIHGIGEHSGRYQEMAEYFNSKSIAVYAIDYRGHGKSNGKRGHFQSYEHIMQDIDALINFTESDINPEINKFIYGHSLGGNLVTNYVLRRNTKFKGVIVSAPWLKLAVPVPGYIKIAAKIIKKIYPAFSQKNDLKTSDLSHNNTIIEKYENDELVHPYITISTFVEASDAAQWALQNKHKLKIPMLLMHGADDKITSPEGSKQFAKQNNNVTLKIWDGLFHEIHNEDNKNELFEYVYNWINKQINKK